MWILDILDMLGLFRPSMGGWSPCPCHIFLESKKSLVCLVPRAGGPNPSLPRGRQTLLRGWNRCGIVLGVDCTYSRQGDRPNRPGVTRPRGTRPGTRPGTRVVDPQQHHRLSPFYGTHFEFGVDLAFVCSYEVTSKNFIRNFQDLRNFQDPHELCKSRVGLGIFHVTN